MTYPKTLIRPAGPDPDDGYETVKAHDHFDENEYLAAGYKLGEPPAKPSKKKADDDLKALRAEYEAKSGKKVFNGWSADQLREKIASL